MLRNHLTFTRAALIAASVIVLGGGSCDTKLKDFQPTDGPWIEGKAAAKTGDVLVIGGATSKLDTTKSVELFDPSTKKFALTAPMKSPRAGIQPISFASGPSAHSTLVPGGMAGTATTTSSSVKLNPVTLDKSESYKNSNSKFAAVGDLDTPRFLYTATLLANGKVLVAGGYNKTKPTKTAELYDPSSKAFSPTGSMKAARAMHAAALLKDGKVLIVGGVDDAHGESILSAEIYDPVTGKFTLATGALPDGSGTAGATATLISGCGCSNEGKVLVAGGFFSAEFAIPNSTTSLALYDPATQTFAAAKTPMRDDRLFHTATVLNDGRILIAGGLWGQILINGSTLGAAFGDGRDSAEIFDPKTGKSNCLGNSATKCQSVMNDERGGHAAVLMTTGPLKGDVLLTGGMHVPKGEKFSVVLDTAEYFDAKKEKFIAVDKMNNDRVFHGAALVQ